MRNYKVKPIQALARGLTVLGALQEMRAASLHDLHKVTGIPKSTLTRILATLYGQQLIWQRLADGAFLPSHTLQERTRLDDADWLGEIASPVLERLCEKVQWPSVLSVPRLDYMEVLETNSRRAYFDEVPARPVKFWANMLRSASGRAYLAFCPDTERDAVLARLRARDVPGHELAHDPVAVRRIVETTRRRGFSVRAADFGGDYAKTRAESDDGRNSIAMPIRVNGHVLGCVNLTWRMSVLTLQQVTDRHLAELRAAVQAIEKRAAAAGVGAPARWEYEPADGQIG
ncbi:MAG TPA: helix-turn-helix domain-containing protein [Streptosporangiaceae bacterium]|nr:helix-turn-helix domain-containing protein [Streptosporangiaceae bacterium]